MKNPMLTGNHERRPKFLIPKPMGNLYQSTASENRQNEVKGRAGRHSTCIPISVYPASISFGVLSLNRSLLVVI